MTLLTSSGKRLQRGQHYDGMREHATIRSFDGNIVLRALIPCLRIVRQIPASSSEPCYRSLLTAVFSPLPLVIHTRLYDALRLSSFTL